MSKKKDKHRHTKRMYDSDPDLIQLALEVECRYLDLCKEHLKLRGTPLNVPANLYEDFIRWREMRVRHKQGDPRHREAEKRSLFAVADWTLEINSEIRNQEVPVVDWAL